jgi:hypothetical protein
MAKLYTKNTWVDESLAEDERYNILTTGGSSLYNDIQIELSSSVAVAGTALDAAVMNNIEDGIDAIDDAVVTINDLVDGLVISNDNIDGRLTLATDTPVTLTDQADKTEIFYTPYIGNRISIYNSTKWNIHTFDELSIKTTNAQDGTSTNGSAVITGLTDTSQLIVGMEASGTGIDSTIASIDSATQVTLADNASATGTDTVTFTLPAGSVVDIFAAVVSDTLALRFGPLWTDANTRATEVVRYNGVNVLTGSTGWRHLGTAYIETAGQVSDSLGTRHLINTSNPVKRKLYGIVTGTSTFTASTSYVPVNANTTNGQGRVSFICPFVELNVSMKWGSISANSGAGTNYSAIALDNESTPDVNNVMITVGNINEFSLIVYDDFPGVGKHYLQRLARVNGGTGTWIEDGGTSKCYFVGEIMG